MKLYHVVCMAKNRVIGKDNRLPWHFSCDLKHFKELTQGSTVLMGRKTYESIGRPLPNRENFVLSKNKDFAKETSGSVKSFVSLEEALKEVKTEKAFVIGGATLYKETFGVIDGIYLTQIDQDYEGDVSYPQIPSNFKETSRKRLQEGPVLEAVYYEKVL